MEYAWNRVLLVLVLLSPVVAMAIAAFLFQRNARRNRLLLLLPLAAVVVAAIGAVSWTRNSSGLVRHVYIQHPLALLAVAPVLALLLFLQFKTLSGISRGRMWTAFLLRATIFNFIVLALAGLQMVIEKDTLSVLFALDCSRSVPESERQRALDFVRKALPAKQATDDAGLLVFGGNALLERAPSPMFAPPDARNIKSVVDGDATDIAQALRLSMAHLNEGSRRRIVLFTDGGQTTGDAADALKRVVSMGADVWIAPLARGNGAEMLIEKLVAPNELMWEQPFDAHVFVYSNVSATARVHLFTGDNPGEKDPPSYTQTVKLDPGKNRVTFSGLRMHSGGAKELKAVLEPLRPEDDTLSENNEAYAYTDVQTDNRVLVLTSDVSEVKFLRAALEDQKLSLDIRAGATLPDNPEAYRAYDCIVLANLARGFLSEQQMTAIQSCVEDQGAGLIMIGGDQSFGAGGYLGTPIEKVLPVEMDLRDERIMPSGALCMLIETCEMPDGDLWGKKICKAAIKTLSPQDYAGLAYWDGMQYVWCFKPTRVGNRLPYLCSMIDTVQTGDIPELDPILSMVVNDMANLKDVSLKHIIVVGDGDWSTATASTIEAARKAKITISALSVYPHNGMHISSMKDLAAAGGGRYYAVDDVKRLPQIFIKEAAVVRKNLIRSDDKGIPISLGAAGPTLKEFGSAFPKVKALVVTQAKPLAEVQLFTSVDGEKVPVLAAWQRGLGKAVAFTSDATNRWAPDWVTWPSYKRFWANLLTWTSRQRMPSNHTITTRVDAGVAHVVVEGLDARGEYLNFAKLAGNAIDPGVVRGDANGKTYELNFVMTAPGRQEATFPVEKSGAYSITVIDQSDPRRPNTIVTGLANSYSAEFARQDGADLLLAQLGEIATGSNHVSRLKDIATLAPLECGLFNHDLPPAREPSDLFWPLIVLAVCLFPFDVAVRRLALDPELAFAWLWARCAPALAAMRLRKRQVQASVEAVLAQSPGAPPPQEIVPSGAHSRAAQSRFERAGESAEAQALELHPQSGKPVVGGSRVSAVDESASDYTRALLKAKKRAKNDGATG